MGDLFLYPSKGNVAFGSGKECWAFTLTRFA
jgi:elongation factor 2